MEYLTRAEFQIFRENVDSGMEKIEKNIEQIHDLAASVRELAASVKQIADNQKKMNEKLESLQQKDGEMWRKLISYIITAMAGAVIMQAFQKFS